MIATSTTSRSGARPARRLALRLTTALVCVVAPASATAATVAVPAGTGVTLPTGIAQSADTSSVWVSDELLGVCRVKLATAGAPAAVVPSPYCMSEPTAENEEAPAPPRSGPSGAGPMAYDPTSSNLFVTEGTSKGAGVWRMQLDPTGTAIQSAEKIVNLGGNRVTALALSPAGNLDFTAKDDAIVRRLAGAAAALQGTPWTVVGATASRAVPSLAHLGEALYLAEGANVTRIATPGTGDTNAVAVAGLGAGAPSALSADESRGLVFAGTALPSTADRVEVLTPGGDVETYAVGFAGVTALTVSADGTMLIGDDPPAAAGHPESAQQGRVHVEARHATGLVQVTFTAQPDSYSAKTTATFEYTAKAGAEFYCRFDGGDWIGCESSSTFTGLSDGAHTFEVRAASAPGGEPGPVARGSFVVDTRAPETVQVDNAPSDRWITTNSLRLRFSTDEQFVRYTCTLDGDPIFGCDSPADLRDLSLGEHEVVLTATDLAGNTSLPRTWRFTRSLPPAPPAAERPADAAPVAAPAPAAPAAPAEPAADAKVIASATPAVAQDCKSVRALTSKGRYAITKDGRALIATLPAPRFARFAKITLRKRIATRRVQTIATRRVTAGRIHTLRVKLTSSQALRLRSGRYRLDAAFGTCATTVGMLRELAPARAMKPKTRTQKGI
ncbi:hypothetical protein BH20ACT16_BH20ACT16_02570 [soil metagenome]